MARGQREGVRSIGRPCSALLIVLFAHAVAANTLTPAPAIHEVDWRTSPLDLNLRGLDGERFRFRCPPGKPVAGQVTGSGPYTDGSAICAAAVHAGVIRAADGGLVTIEIRPGEPRYDGSVSHYMRSESYGLFWSGSFVVLAPQAAGAPPWSLSGH